MFCSSCREELGNARFCPNCGTPRAERAPRASRSPERSDTPRLVLRPRFIGWASVLTVLPIQLFMTVWGAGFFGGFGFAAIDLLGLPWPGWIFAPVFGVLFFVGIPLLTYVSHRQTYVQTEYRFYDDRLEYAEGFWTAERKSIPLDRVAEVSLRRGVIQRRYGIGTLYLATAATGNGQSGSGISLRDIPDAERLFDQVKELIGQSRRESPTFTSSALRP
jgi:membrane protein YdbS with pleckstrin-like domain